MSLLECALRDGDFNSRYIGVDETIGPFGRSAPSNASSVASNGFNI